MTSVARSLPRAVQNVPVGSPVNHEAAIVEAVEWVVEATHDRDWREVLPRAAEYLAFDYEIEDRFRASLTS